MKVIATTLKDEIILNINGTCLKKFSKKYFYKYFKEQKEFKTIELLDIYLVEIELKVAKNYAFYLLSYKNYPSHLLIQKLIDIGIRKDIAKDQIKKLCEMGYIDDNAYIKYLIQTEIKRGYGPYYIRLKLLNKKFQLEIIDEKLNEIICKEEEKRLIEINFQKIKKTKSKTQIYQSLVRKGFDISLIQEIISCQ
jgi:regulatory protein